jgi:CRISPR/Cas system-associated exonuclease Cas4 (RecB family)
MLTLVTQNKRPLSASQITTWLACGRKYAFRYVDKLEPEHRPAALALGRAVHSAIEALHLAKLDDIPVTPTDVVRVFKADWEAELDGGGLSYKHDESANLLRHYGESLVFEYVKWLGDRRIVAAEQPFEVELVEPETGECSGEKLRGYFDVIFENDVIGEVKTAARRFDEGTLARKLQFSAYAYSWRQMRGRDPTVLVVSLLKQRRPEIAASVAKRALTDDAFFVQLALEVADAIDQRCFPANPSFMCGDCEYAKACRTFRGERGFVHPPPAAVGDLVPVGALVPKVLAQARAVSASS